MGYLTKAGAHGRARTEATQPPFHKRLGSVALRPEVIPPFAHFSLINQVIVK